MKLVHAGFRSHYLFVLLDVVSTLGQQLSQSLSDPSVTIGGRSYFGWFASAALPSGKASMNFFISGPRIGCSAASGAFCFDGLD